MNASVYIYGANHGQFNEKWGRGDGAGTANQFFLIYNKLCHVNSRKQLLKY